MATKDGKRMETMALRSSRRMKAVQSKQEKKLVPENIVERADEQELNHQTEDHKEQQITPKNDKDTTLPSNNEPQPINNHEDNTRRRTRSSLLQPKKIISEPELPLDQLTPEDNPVQVEEEEPTCKKMVKASSYAWHSEGGSAQLLGTVRKGVSRVQSIISPYSEIRKSYRKIHRKEIVSIPYRKCHDAFEGRIVTIINKIESGKNCLRDFQSLIDKIQRISPKDMLNRYIISGISTIARITAHNHLHDPLHSRFQQEQSLLKTRIEEELDRTDDFDHCLLPKNQQVIDGQQYKISTMRRIYKAIKKHHRHYHPNIKEMRERVMRDCEKHFTGEINVGSLVKFIRQKIEVIHQ